jgi:hypothetical protein
MIRSTLALSLLCISSGACTPDHKAPQAAGHTEHALAAEDGTLCGPGYPDYAPGTAVKVGALTAKLVAARPDPPRQKVPNQWDVEISSESGAPVTGVTLSNPDSFMPAHNHHGRTRPSVGAAAEGSVARIDDIDFSMRGPWQVRVDLQQAGTKLGTATFQICVR